MTLTALLNQLTHAQYHVSYTVRFPVWIGEYHLEEHKASSGVYDKGELARYFEGWLDESGYEFSYSENEEPTLYATVCMRNGDLETTFLLKPYPEVD